MLAASQELCRALLHAALFNSYLALWGTILIMQMEKCFIGHKGISQDHTAHNIAELRVELRLFSCQSLAFYLLALKKKKENDTKMIVNTQTSNPKWRNSLIQLKCLRS